MADIRAFFAAKGKKKEDVKAKEIAVAAPVIAKERKFEGDLRDSDDDFEGPKPERKRIRTQSTKSEPAKKEPAPEAIDLTDDTSTNIPTSSPIQAPTDNPKPSPRESENAAITQPQNKKALPSLSRRAPQLLSTSKSIQSVNSFFGDSDAEPIAKAPRLEAERSISSEKSSKPSAISNSKKIVPVQIPQDVILESIPPRGRENCLDGYKIAFTGGMGEYMPRTDLEELVLQYGGKVAQNVSGKTTLLVASPKLEDGRDSNTSSKYRSALEKNVYQILDSYSNNLQVQIISEADFLALIQGSGDQSTNLKTLTVTSKASVITVSRVVASSSLPSDRRTPLVDDSQLLWVDKYKPKKLEDLVGAAEAAKKILDWLKRWPDVHIKKSVKIPFSKENPGAKSILLSGPPGIGKTTLANLVAKTIGYEVLEFNASDVRSKSAIIEQVSDIVHSQAMGMDGTLRKRLIIMDEVDGMGGSDRGGIPELIKVIKTSLTPIICVCNDRQERKIRSLANHCYDLRLRRPTKKMIADRLIKISEMEGLMIEPNAADLLVEQMGNDIRQVINASQMWRAQSTIMRYRDLVGPVGGVIPYVDSEEGDNTSAESGRMRGIQKDKILRQSPFDACGLILGGRKSDFNERYNSFFIDYSLLPLLVEQNYIDSSRNGIFKASGSEDNKLEQLSSAADSVSDMELAGSAINGNDMHWELLPLQAALSLRVGDRVQGFQGFPTFPQWLGKYSSTNKVKRLTHEIVRHTNLTVRQGFDPIRLEYVPYLRSHLLHFFRSGNSDSDGKSSEIDEVIRTLDEYGLSRDDLMETMKDMQFIIPGDKNLFDRFEILDPKTKTAFTKRYNSMDHKSQALIEEYQMSKRKARSRVSPDELGDEDLGTTEDLEAAKVVEDEKDSSDEEAIKDFIKKHSKPVKNTSQTRGTKRKK